MPDRRLAIQQLLLICAGTVVIPACFRNKHGGQASQLLKNVTVTGDQENLLAELAEIILPRTDSPGAKDLSAHLFALKMLDDCLPRKDQEKFMLGFQEFETFARKRSGKPFMESDPHEQQAIVAGLDGRKTEDPLGFFYQTLKRFTIQAYSTSQFYLTYIRNY
jgi:hypothetical protein